MKYMDLEQIILFPNVALNKLYFYPKGFQTNCTPSATSIMTDGNAEDAVKSLLEVPIEKPVLLSDAALTNLYNISHNVQESYSKSSCL